MKDKYTLKELAKTFLKHSEEEERNRLEMLENYPDSEHWKNEFNIPMALHCICEEIDNLKCQLEELSRDT